MKKYQNKRQQQDEIADADLITFSGVIARILYGSPTTSWGIALVQPERDEIQRVNSTRPSDPNARYRDNLSYVKCVGVLASSTPGVKLEISGGWKIDPKFGLQFAVKSSKLSEGILPDNASRDAVCKLLTSFHGVGLVTANDIYDHFEERGGSLALVADLNDVGAELANVVTNQAVYDSIMAGWAELASKAGILAFLYDLGFGAALAQRIHDYYRGRNLNSEATMRLIRENPYTLIDDVPGIGFKMADEAALKLGVPVASPFRKIAALAFCLQEAAQNGDTILLRTEAYERVMQCIGQPMLPLMSESSEASMCAEQASMNAGDASPGAHDASPGAPRRSMIMIIPADEALSAKFRIIFAKGTKQHYVGSRRLVEAEFLVNTIIKQMLTGTGDAVVDLDRTEAAIENDLDSQVD